MQTNQMLCEKIYETWGIDVPMEDIPGLVSVNAIAAYLADALACQTDDDGGLS